MTTAEETTQMRPAGDRGHLRRRSRWMVKLALAALPVFALPSGACVDMAARVAINSFFDGVTPLLQERVQAQLAPAGSPDETP